MFLSFQSNQFFVDMIEIIIVFDQHRIRVGKTAIRGNYLYLSKHW